MPGRPDRLADELTAYSTRYWFFHPPSAAWRFSEALKSPVTMTLTNDSRMPPSVGEINIFKERSVATHRLGAEHPDPGPGRAGAQD